MRTLLLLLALVLVVRTERVCTALPSDPPGAAEQPCVLPFVWAGERFKDCAPFDPALAPERNLSKADLTWCPYDVSATGEVNAWGFCSCHDTTLPPPSPPSSPSPSSPSSPPTLAPSPSPSIPSPVAAPVVPSPSPVVPSPLPPPFESPCRSPLLLNASTGHLSLPFDAVSGHTCLWHIQTPRTATALREPNILLVFTSLALGAPDSLQSATLSVYESATVEPRKLIFSSGQELPPVLNATSQLPQHWGTWTTLADLLVAFKLTINPTGSNLSPVALNADYYVGFCSDYDGVITLPRSKPVWNRQAHMPFIATTYSDKERLPYRPEAVCSWKILAHPTASVRTTLFFRLFDLSKGDRLVYKTADPSSWQVYSAGRQPPLVYLGAEEFALELNSDGSDKANLGIEADVLHDECTAFPLPLTASTGEINDGTAALTPYKRGLSCSWHLAPADATVASSYVLLSFNYANFGPSDVLSVYEGSSASAKPIKILKGARNDTDARKITLKVAKEAFITFTSAAKAPVNWTSGNVSLGFSLTWLTCGKACSLCETGEHYDPATDKCVPCEAPLVSTEPGQLVCVPCPEEEEWMSPSQCASCKEGTVFDTKQNKCVPCPPHSYRDDPFLQALCEPCPAGSIAVNGTSCSNCTAGFRPKADANECEEIPVPPVPHNNTTILIYVFVALGALLIVGAVIALIQYRKAKQDSSWGYEPLSL